MAMRSGLSLLNSIFTVKDAFSKSMSIHQKGLPLDHLLYSCPVTIQEECSKLSTRIKKKSLNLEG